MSSVLDRYAFIHPNLFLSGHILHYDDVSVVEIDTALSLMLTFNGISAQLSPACNCVLIVN